MEKLTELINKYKEENNILNTDMDGQLEIGKYIYVNYPCVERLCSKKFGFIERLVKQNKIDDSKVGNSDMLSVQYHDLVNDYKYEGLIMILSISDNPISDLCSYLK